MDSQFDKLVECGDIIPMSQTEMDRVFGSKEELDKIKKLGPKKIKPTVKELFFIKLKPKKIKLKKKIEKKKTK